MTKTEVIKMLTNKKNSAVIHRVRPLFKSIPNMPKGIVTFLVSIMPWLVGLVGVVSLFGGISLFLSGIGLTSAYWLTTLAGFPQPYMVIGGFLEVVSGVILLMAFNPLRERLKNGWILLFWSLAVDVVNSVASLIFIPDQLPGGLFGLVLFFFIAFYLYFQIESAYKEE